MKDPFVRAQEELASEFKRKAYLEDNFKLVKPKEIVLNPEEVKQGARKDVVHYIPLLEAFRNLVEDQSFITALENARNDARVGDGQIEDVTHGSAYKESKYFKDNPDAHALMMYSEVARGLEALLRLLVNTRSNRLHLNQLVVIS